MAQLITTKMDKSPLNKEKTNIVRTEIEQEPRSNRKNKMIQM